MMTVQKTHFFYIIIITISTIFWCLSECGTSGRITIVLPKKRNSSFDFGSMIMTLICFFVLLIPLANRTCGADTDEYYKIYTGVYILASDTTFSYLCMILRFISADPKTGLGMIGAITLLLFFFALKNVRDEIDTKFAFFAFATALYFYLYNYVRMMLATSIIFVGYSYLVKKQNNKAFIFFLIAPFFHQSALLVLGMYFVIVFFTKYKKLVSFVACITIGIFIYRPELFFGLITDSRYDIYLRSTTFSNSSIGIGTFVLLIPFFVILIIYRRQKKEYVFSAALYLCIASLGFSLLGYFVAPASRLSNMYFIFHLVFFIPWLIKRETSKGRKTVLILFGFCYCVMKYYVLTFNFSAMGILPYS